MLNLKTMKFIPGYEGLYAATEDGRIFSYRKNRFLRPRKNKDGYYRVDLCKNGKSKTYLVHRLIAATYLDNPENLLQVNHKDEDKTNNALLNLEWISPKDNINYGTGKERSAKSRQKKVICLETKEVFDSVTEAAKAVNINPSNISRCLTGRHKTAASYHWRYYEEEKD